MSISQLYIGCDRKIMRTNTDLMLINTLGMLTLAGEGGGWVDSTGLIRYLCLEKLNSFYRKKLDTLEKNGWVEKTVISNRLHWRLSQSGKQHFKERMNELIGHSRLPDYGFFDV